jgi:hypothetical protein
MRVKYQLWYQGRLCREMAGNVEEISALRAKFWKSIGLPWRGAEVRLVRG